MLVSVFLDNMDFMISNSKNWPCKRKGGLENNKPFSSQALSRGEETVRKCIKED